MSNYVLENITKYNEKQSAPVTLVNYQRGVDNESDKNFVILNIINEDSETLKSLEFNILEYDNRSELIKTSNYLLTDINVRGKKKYIPFNKFLLLKETKSFKFELVKATYQDKVFSDNEYEYFEPKILNKKIKRYSYERKMFPILIPLLMFSLFIGLLLVNTNKFLDSYKLEHFNYTKSSGDGIIITKYNGNSRDVIIPSHYEGEEVIGIGQRAFYGSNIKSVDIKAENITIGISAFENARSLKTVRGTNIDTVSSFAFKNAIMLRNFEFNSVNNIDNYAFSGSVLLRTLKINNLIDTNLTRYSLSGSNLKGNKENESYKVLNGMLYYINEYDELIIKDSLVYNSISTTLYDQIREIRKLEIDTTKMIIDQQFFVLFESLEVLIIHKDVKLIRGNFAHLATSIAVLNIPQSTAKFVDLFSNISNYNIYELTINDVTKIPEDYMIGASEYVRNIYPK